MLDKGNNHNREAVARDEEFRATRVSSRSTNSTRHEVEDSREELEEEILDGYHVVIDAVLGDILPQTARTWYRMLVEEASRPQGVEDAARLATAVSQLRVVSPHVYMRW